MHDPDFLPDGYDRPFYIEPVPGLHGALRGRFRPMLPTQSAAILESPPGETTPKRYVRWARIVAPHLIAWSLTEKDAHCGEQLQREITPDNILHLPPTVFRRLVDIVSGFGASDTDPDWPAALALDNDTDDMPPGMGLLEKDTKN